MPGGGVSVGAVDLERPLALLLLLLPLALLVLVRLRARPEEHATGTLEIWRRAAAGAPHSAARTRRRIPPAIWILCAALVCGAVAAAGPRRMDARHDGLLVVVDRSPSMYLHSGGATRLEHALARARDWIGSVDHARITWAAPPARAASPSGEDGFKIPDMEPATGPAMPEAWKQAPNSPRGQPDFAAYDLPGCVWITDRAPDVLPVHAGYVCSGGEAVPGPIGVQDGHLVAWDGARMTATAEPVGPRMVTAVDELPELVVRAVSAWCAARGHELVREHRDSAALRIVGRVARNVVSPEVVVGRDGWSARASVAGDAPAHLLDFQSQPVMVLPMQTWLADETGARAWVTHRPGHVSVALTSLDRLDGDPAAFAVSWASLFDACILLPPDCVPLGERLSAGEQAARAPRAAPSTRPAPNRWPATAAAVALVLALLALALVRPGSRGVHPAGRSETR